jgi:hypothetical protein
MCDYSLHGVASRPAQVGDRLVTTDFRNTLTRGFAAVEEPAVAVCLMPGTELAFETEVERHYAWLQTLFFRKDKWKIPHKVGRFRQINVDNPATHHDAIEFPDGRVVLLTRLRAGQCATVLQLPARPHAAAEAKTGQRSASPAPAG